MDADTATSSCHKHADRVAVAACDDCGTGLCARCQVEIDAVGTFCWRCAARRGGLRPGHRPLRADAPPEARPIPGGSFERIGGVRAFEERVGNRAGHPLISGLTERLTAAGVDPQDVVDDGALAAEIDHLQDLAGAEPEHRRRRHRR
jgi:hypothetical protein